MPLSPTEAEELISVIDEIEAKLTDAITELNAVHYPATVAPGKEPYGCATCYPADSDWPCVSKMVADELGKIA